jgi:hypothetical protein
MSVLPPTLAAVPAWAKEVGGRGQLAALAFWIFHSRGFDGQPGLSEGSFAMIRKRQHWIILIRPVLVIMTALGVILVWAALSPGTVIRLLHVTSDSPEVVLAILRGFYEHRILCAGVPLAIAAFMFLTSWGLWSMSYFEVDDYGFTYKVGPFAQNTIPLRAIQDIRTSTSALGLLLGYGTLIVDSGREEETLRYVPGIDEFVDALRGGGFR